MGPYVQSKEKTSKMVLHVMIALTPIILFAIYKNGYVPYSHGYGNLFSILYSFLFMLIGAITSFAIESLYYVCRKQKHKIKTSYSFFPGLFLSLLLPIHTPIYVLIIGAALATIVGKLIFGGFGKNIFNPALIGYILVIALFGSVLGSYHNAYELDTISKATPLTNASIISGIGNYDTLVKPYGNLLNFFLGTIPGGMGEVSALLCIVAFVYLILTKTIKWRIPIFYVGTVFILTMMVGRLLGQDMYYPLFHILSGGLLFGAVFMATDPVTSCVTPIGQILQGIALGILTVIIRFTAVEGVATSILIVNMLVFLFDRIGAKSRFNLSKVILPFAIMAILVMITGVGVAAMNRPKGSTDPNFAIVSKEKKNNETIYVVTQKGYGGNIKAQITFINDRITQVDILSEHETKDRYQMVMNQNYIDQLIQNQDHLENVDTISSATVTSTALKKMIENVWEDYH